MVDVRGGAMHNPTLMEKPKKGRKKQKQAKDSVSRGVETILDIGRGETLVLPQRETLVGGLKVVHLFSRPDVHPYDQCQWEKRNVSIMDYAKGKPSFHREGVEVPCHWSENSVRITSAKYLFGAEVGQPEYEDSLRHPFDRIANTYTIWGWKNGYFATLDDAKAYNWEMKAMLINQIWAPNSPVWFNIGHWEQWRWGRSDLRSIYANKGNKAYKAHKINEEIVVKEIDNSMSHPQLSACFLTELDDSMESILSHGITEGRIFSSGSGVGVNISTLRSSHEPISGRGKSSGPISFNKGWDRMAGAVKSGGRSRRAARMVVMDSDHPDVFDFLRLKNSQEHIAKVILREHNSHVELKKIAEDKLKSGSDAEKVAASFILSLPLVNAKKYAGDMDGEIYGDTISDQNANHSISLRGDFWKAYWAEGMYSTRWVTNPDHIQETFKASQLLEEMSKAVYDNAEPGCHNNDYINLWSPVKSKGRINTSNPCSEYLFANNTSCNLASFNAYRFLKDGSIDIHSLRTAARLAMIAADLNIEEGGFPTPEIAEGSYVYRTTGIGFGNIGGLLMSLGIPYDSDEGRFIAGLLTSELSASCWKTSEEMGREIGCYYQYPETKTDLQEVLELHKACHRMLLCLPEIAAGAVDSERKIKDLVLGKKLPQAEGLTGSDALRALAKSFKLLSPWDQSRLKSTKLMTEGVIWDDLNTASSLRNSFVSLYAPMGTISAPLGIYDEGTTSAEPDYTLVKYKSLSGGGSMTMFNSLALIGLKTMGYNEFQVREAALEVAGVNGLIIACEGNVGAVVKQLKSQPDAGDRGPVRLEFEKALGRGEESIDELISKISSGRQSGLPPLVISGRGNVEAVPWLSSHHKEVFDCAATTGGGSRAIAPDGHIRMLGSLMPFISGAVSKTVNLPHYATEEDILECFEMSHKMGVKCIALYRADSKGVSVFAADSPEAQRWSANSIWDNLVKSVESNISGIKETASQPRRRKLPGSRNGQIIKFEIAGSLDGFIVVGTYPDGRCGEVFGRLGQGGSFAHGMFESFCKAFSVMLQWGVPLQKATDSFKNLAFDPAGFVKVAEGSTDADIKSCKSVVDLMMKILEWLFPLENGSRLRGQTEPNLEIDNGTIKMLHCQEQSAFEDPEGLLKKLGAAEMCPECHGLSVIQDGKCKRCTNCGFSNGGCGG